MSNFDNTNKGIIAKNNRKEKDTHPDITGQINVEGADFVLSGWLKERKDGSGKFYSLSIKRKEAQAPSNPSAPAAIDSDLPF